MAVEDYNGYLASVIINLVLALIKNDLLKNSISKIHILIKINFGK
jgi:hypothetical protein